MKIEFGPDPRGRGVVRRQLRSKTGGENFFSLPVWRTRSTIAPIGASQRDPPPCLASITLAQGEAHAKSKILAYFRCGPALRCRNIIRSSQRALCSCPGDRALLFREYHRRKLSVLGGHPRQAGKSLWKNGIRRQPSNILPKRFSPLPGMLP